MSFLRPAAAPGRAQFSLTAFATSSAAFQRVGPSPVAVSLAHQQRYRSKTGSFNPLPAIGTLSRTGMLQRRGNVALQAKRSSGGEKPYEVR